MTDSPTPNLPVGNNLKIGLFHLGSGMADVITTGIWNRVMISDLGYAATPVGLLVSLRYFLAPISVWAGRMSDRFAVGGYRRLFWIWLGRALMAISIIAVGLGTAALMRGGGATGLAGGADAGLWLILSLALILFSFGNAISGSTFLALIYDRAAESQRSRAVGIVWTFLLVGFAVGGIAFGIALPAHAEGEATSFTPELLQNLFVIAALILGTLWFGSLVGEERRAKAGQVTNAHQEYTTSAVADLRLALKDRSMRFFFWFLSLSMLFAFSQDLILEPFGGQVFNMPASVTTRFTAYWAVTAIIGTIVFLVLSRRIKWLTNTNMADEYQYVDHGDRLPGDHIWSVHAGRFRQYPPVGHAGIDRARNRPGDLERWYARPDDGHESLRASRDFPRLLDSGGDFGAGDRCRRGRYPA